MWLLIECDDPATGPGHNEKRRILFPKTTAILMERKTTDMFPNGYTLLPGPSMESHPCTPGDTGYHCPICHKDVPPKFIPIPTSALPGKINIDKKDLDKLRELEESP